MCNVSEMKTCDPTVRHYIHYYQTSVCRRRRKPLQDYRYNVIIRVIMDMTNGWRGDRATGKTTIIVITTLIMTM